MPAPAPPRSRVSEAQLIRAARAATGRAYAPYSRFPVGAAVLTGSRRVYTGCNVENASYSLCTCAERTAILAAVAAGERELRCIVIHTPTSRATSPCGACRQVIREFGPKARVLSVCDTAHRLDSTIEALLPRAFGPADVAPMRPAARGHPPSATS